MIRKSVFFILISISSGICPADGFLTDDHSKSAFSKPFPSLTRVQKREFSVGNSFFRLNWVRPPASTESRDGLGPTFNAVSCSSCHQFDGRGPAVTPSGNLHVSLLLRLQGAEEMYGGQLNPLGVAAGLGEGQQSVSFTSLTGQYADGESFALRQPQYLISDWLLGAPSSHMRISPRVGNQMIGLGLIERISAADLEQKADPDDRDGDGISGRVSHVLNLRTGKMDIGRFGWKAEQPTVEQQVAGAFLGDMGLTTSLHLDENCPAPQLACRAEVNGGAPEVSDQILERVSFYSRSLAVPKPRVSVEAELGRQIFERIGCTGCHTPAYNIDAGEIHPYSDYLLHDMGPELADHSLGGDVLPTEWRTPPLWGIGLFHIVSGHTNLLHDGRARGVAEAILWHFGEGSAARQKFIHLPKVERSAVVRFVESL